MGYSNVFGVNNFVPAMFFACTINLNKLFRKKQLLFFWYFVRVHGPLDNLLFLVDYNTMY